MIKNIVFDIGNIILEGSSKTALTNMDLPESIKNKIETVIFDNPKWVNLDLGLDDYNSYFEKIKEGLPKEIQEISKDVLIKSPEYRTFNEEIMSLIKKLSNTYKIYILSDNNINIFNYLKTTELNKYVNGWCISAIHHEMKKDKQLFKILFTTNNLNPKECYYIDDRLENIKIGNEFGMKGFTLDWDNNKFEDLIEDMQNSNIVI